KYEEICAPKVEEFCYITDNTYFKEEKASVFSSFYLVHLAVVSKRPHKVEMKNMMEELNKRISNLEEKIAKEESDKLEARNAAEKVCKEKSAELERIQDKKSAAERKALSNEDLYKQSQEYNMSLQ
ncbi:hypothetical protein PIB30_087895, partial [Stylosanthes scabra]|nr:hypothetical protein [Stylosanthes scabra]